ncbi:MAG: DUF4111 domain-containing protein [Lachnospiraceae bacterium]|nr:DUF4111 domain-containing protein [Lachnospiraceae bacterium]
MHNYNHLLNDFVLQSRQILKDNLTGIYLHGSAVMGCFQAERSDIDLLIVVKDGLSKETKRQYMDMVVALNERAPKKGLELSIVRECVCNPFVYPTPFELHFSITHLNWYQENPDDYVEKMQGVDKDLAAHFTILYHRGKVLFGREVKSVFGEVSSEDYMDSIWLDIRDARSDILDNPMYIILNLCRVLAYKKEGLVLSKAEGGLWGKEYISEPVYKRLIDCALEEYQNGESIFPDESVTVEFAEYMLKKIGSEV